ncbi:hypothetical protein [Neobacillus terrae]|uniref:hypothetical protein n=1 Tax=Neobacillus terrae TaxID=3034837 RepID=UPI00140DDE4E|nr:hypothetical protein [Neobacillus terrae]NHM30657.1 hypothetical protein [Neobacillus terrae]
MIREIILKYHSLSVIDKHHRFKSWEHCYNFFLKNTNKLSEEIVFDHASLHLAFYLASWGMLRGSSFLLQKDYTVHSYFLKNVVMNPEYRKYLDQSQKEKIGEEDIKGINNLINDTKRAYLDNIKEVYGEKTIINVTDTLASKIILGIYGNVPAYDRYFKDALVLFGINSQCNEQSLRELANFYNMYFGEFSELKKLFSSEGVQYTPMKLIDMYFWQIGYMMDNIELYKDELININEFSNHWRSLEKEKNIVDSPQTLNRRPIMTGLTEKIRRYILSLLYEAKNEGEEFLDLRSGDIHKELGLSQRLPPVCNAMMSIPGYSWTIIKDTPSGMSSTKVVRYYLHSPVSLETAASVKE